LDGKLIQKNILEVNKKNELRILNLELEPQENILEFVTTQESMPYGAQKRGISIDDDFTFYTYEFNTLVKMPDNGSFFVNLYPYSIFDVKYLLPLKEINIDGKAYTLKFNKREIEYKINKPLSFKKGINQIKFLQTKNENYYLLIASRLPEIDAELIKLKVINENPVFYKIKVESRKSNSFLLIFNESFDEGWRAYYLEPSGGYKEIVTHFPINGYANGYYLNLQGKNRQPVTIVLKYIYQNQFWVGLAIASLVFSGCGFISIFIYFSKNSKIKHGTNRLRKKYAESYKRALKGLEESH
jgi:hypothetical protein